MTKLTKTIGQGIVAVIICANRDFSGQFKAAGIDFKNAGSSIKACQNCYRLGLQALKQAKEMYPTSPEFDYQSAKHVSPKAVNKVITCGATTIVQLLGAVARHEIALDTLVFESLVVESSRPSATFCVDQLVDVAKRTEPGMCAPGGVARISKVSVSHTGDELYDVSYVHSRAKEYSLPVSLLKEVIQCAGRPRRSLEAAITADDSKAERLQRQLDAERARHTTEITNLEFHNSDLRRRLREANSEQKTAKAAIAGAMAALEAERVQRQIDLEVMVAQVEELSQQAAVAASTEERARSDAILRECFEKHKREKAVNEQRVRDLKKVIVVANGKLLVLESSVEGMLLDQAKVLRAEHRETEEAMQMRHKQAEDDLVKRHRLEAQALNRTKEAALAEKARAEHHAAIAVRDALSAASKSAAAAEAALLKLHAAHDQLAELRDQLDALGVGTCPEYRPLSYYCKTILTDAEYEIVSRIPSLDKLGVDALSVSDMGDRRRRDLATVCDVLMSRILVSAKAGSPDPSGIIRAITQLRSAAQSPMGAALLEHAPFDHTEHPTVKAIAQSYLRCMQAGDKFTARSMLSVLVSSGQLTDAQVMRICSQRNSVVAGDVVVVPGPGAARTKMKVGAINSETALVYPLGETEESACEVPHAQYRSVNDVQCTVHQIREAKVHALQKFPGAKFAPIITRSGGIDPVRAAFVAQFLRDPTVVEVVEASLAKAKKVRWRLKQRPWPLWKRLVHQMESMGHKPVSWGYFWGVVANGEYELQTADNCCCGTCRDLGYRNYDDLRDMIQTLKCSIEAASDGLVSVETTELLLRVKKNEEFRRGSYPRHLENFSSTGPHCLTALLSSFVDRRFRKACTHGRSDARVVPPPQTMEEMLGRKPKPTDWNDKCEVCWDKKGIKEEAGNVFKCSHCNVVAHKICIERSHWDLPSSKSDAWTCVQCVREIDDCQHDSSCDLCNESEFIIADVQRLIELLRSVEKKQPEPSVPASKKVKGGSAKAKNIGGGIEALASEILSSRLEQFAAKEQQYISHLIRDRNQGCFKSLAEDTMTIQGFYVLMDYWAKFNSRKADVACCEGNQIGISTHGMMFICVNPSKGERALIDSVHGPQPWDLFGPARDEEGGLHFLEEHFNIFCDDSKQGVFHTQSEVEATIQAFIIGRPWLNRSRCAFVQSDNASNYRDPTTEVMCRSIRVRCFSEAGMGKDEEDGNAGVNKRLFAAVLDRGYDLECADDLFRHALSFKLRGQRYGVLKVNRKKERPAAGRVSVPQISNYGLWTIDEDSITFYENLDVASSKELMSSGGQAVGFGEGVKMTLSEFNKKHSTQQGVTGATLDLASDHNTRQRPSRDEKAAAKDARQRKKSERARALEAKSAAASAAAEAHSDRVIEQCPRCGKSFLTRGWYVRHSLSFCPNRSEVFESRKQARRVDIVLDLNDERALQEYKERISRLRDVFVRLRGRGRIGLSVDPHTHRVLELHEKGLAFLSGKIDRDFVLVSIDGVPVSSDRLSVLEKELSSALTLDLTFKRPVPQLPLHGIARKGIHKSVHYVLHDKQLEWLNQNVFAGGRTLLRDKPAASAMKAHFHRTLREDTMTPMWLDQERISNWLSARVKEEKFRRKAAARTADSSGHGGTATKKSARKKRVHSDDEDSNENGDSGKSSESENTSSSEESETSESDEGS